MAKVSISLPNNAQITLEFEESEILREVVGLALRDLPRELMRPAPADENNTGNGATEKSTSVAASALAAATMTAEPEPPVEPGPPAATAPSKAPAEPTIGDGNGAAMPPEFLSESGRAAFTEFCQNANPLGDMRRVVVAAEGASRHFGVDGVNAEELGWLFDVAGWRKPGNFTQTLRNAARSKFGWLERIPGRSGRYAATTLGLSKTLVSG
jgi:hypothetical protein